MAAASILSSFSGFWAPDAELSSSTEFPKIAQEQITSLLVDSLSKLRSLPALIRVPPPVVIVGDLHGSILDLVRILQGFGAPPDTRYLFLGDYVDRGEDSVAVICLVLALFCRHPDRLFLLRGNHEFSHINRVYGFRDEILISYHSDWLWGRFQDVFSWLPLAALVDDGVFCVHGGLSPQLDTVQAIADLEMPIPNYIGKPMISDIVWSDPVDTICGFEINKRGSGQIFGADVVEDFLRRNNLKLLIRAHQCNEHGYVTFANMLGVTVFSSSNYCQLSENKCGVLTIKEDKEVAFYSVDPDSELSFVPRAIMSLPLDGDIGLRKMFRTSSSPDLAAEDDEELFGPVMMKRSASLTSALSDLG
jgi:diadenosine tetraphosphatase ApaH/serine/threonine PP2A family protein phosphatase